jgi:hypothetical protein
MGNGIGWVPDGGAQAREPQQPQRGEQTGSQQNATATATATETETGEEAARVYPGTQSRGP